MTNQSTHGFIVLLHSIGERLDRKVQILNNADIIVREIIECIESIDKAIDIGEKEQKINHMMFGHTKIVSALRDVYLIFGKEKGSKICEKIIEAFDEMTKAFIQESSLLMKMNSGIYPDEKQLIEMQILRNLDLLLYFEIYFELLSVSKNLRAYIKQYIVQFGLIDVTIDDIVDIEDDHSNCSYNIFLIQFSRRMNLKRYPQMSPEDVLSHVKQMGIMQEVYSMIIDHRKEIPDANSVYDQVKEYLERVIEKRYSFFLKQLPQQPFMAKPQKS